MLFVLEDLNAALQGNKSKQVDWKGGKKNPKNNNFICIYYVYEDPITNFRLVFFLKWNVTDLDVHGERKHVTILKEKSKWSHRGLDLRSAAGIM